MIEIGRYESSCGRAGSRGTGFTLVEVLIVVVVLGILAAMAIPMAANASSDARISATVTEIRSLREIATRYNLETGLWPADVSQGVVPTEFLTTIGASTFSDGPAIGGMYDWDVGYGPFAVAISINDSSPPTDQWTKIDRQLDDGVLTTGWVRQHGNNLQFRLQP